MKSAVKLGVLGALLAGAARAQSTNPGESRKAAAQTTAAQILERLEQAATYFNPVAKRGASFTVIGVDEMGKDLASELQAALNAGVAEDAPDVNLFFSGVARSGTHLKSLAAKSAAEGVPAVYFSLFTNNEEANKQPWVLVPGMGNIPDAEGVDQKVAIMAGLAAKAAGEEAGDDDMPPFLKELLGGLKARTSGCEGCVTGKFSAKGKSIFMKFCPSNPIGQVLGGAAPHLDAVGLDPITVEAVTDDAIPEGAVIHSINS